jgi:RNA polymerase sigma-70 factor (ECF subfamily)
VCLNKSGKAAIFEKIYLDYFSKMKHFAKVYVLSEEEAENIVQDVFTELWEKRDTRLEYANLVSYLFVSVKTKCLNFLRHQAIMQASADKIQEEYMLTLQAGLNSLEVLDPDFLSERNISGLIKKALDSLPERCRQIFIMNKIEGKKHKEIAGILNISVNTIETQMGIAYRHLRRELGDCLPLLFFIYFC